MNINFEGDNEAEDYEIYDQPEEEERPRRFHRKLEAPRMSSDTAPWWRLKLMRMKDFLFLNEEIDRLEAENNDLKRDIKISGNAAYMADAQSYAHRYHEIARELAEAQAQNAGYQLKCQFYEGVFTKLFGGTEMEKAMKNTFRDIDGKIRSNSGRTKEESADLALQLLEQGLSKQAIMQKLEMSSEQSLDTYLSIGRSQKKKREQEYEERENAKYVFSPSDHWWIKETYSLKEIREMVNNGKMDANAENIGIRKGEFYFTCNDPTLLKLFQKAS